MATLLKRRGIYYARWRDHGREVRRSLKTSDLRAAQRRLKMLQETVVLGGTTHPSPRHRKDITPDQFWPLYLAWAETHKATMTIRTDRFRWQAFLDYVKPRTLGAVTQHDIERYIRHRRKIGRPPTENRDCVHISARP